VGIECPNGAKDLLGQLHRAGTSGGFHFAAMVGPCCNHTHYLRELVDRLSQRLVLSAFSPLQDVASNVCTNTVETQLAVSGFASKAVAGLRVESSSGGAPIAIDPEIAERSPRLLS